MEDPADYLASKYKYIFRVPGAQRPTVLVAVSAGLIGLLAGQLSGKHLHSVLYGLAGFAAVPLLLSVISSSIFRGIPIHSTFRRLCQLTLLSNYVLIAGLLAANISALLNLDALIPILSASLAVITYIRLTLTWMVDGDGGLPVAAWSLIDSALASLFTSLTVGATIPSMILAGPLIGAAIAVPTITYFSIPDRDGISSARLSRGFAQLLLEGNPTALEDSLYRLGTINERVTEAFVFKGKRSGKLSALIILPFHMGPFGRMGSAMLNWLVEAEAAKSGINAVAVKGCTTHKSDIISSSDAARVAAEIAEGLKGSYDVWSDEAAVREGLRVGSVEGLMIELAGRKIAVVSLHPEPMEDIPEEITPFAEELNISVIDTHNSFSPSFKRLTTRSLMNIQNLLREISSIQESVRGKLRVSLSKLGFGRHEPRKGIGPCGYSLLAFTVDGLKVALGVADGNNAMPWVREALRRSLSERGWHVSELLTTDTHSVNGVVLGGRGYFPVGEKTSREEIVSIFDELSSEAEKILEESETAYLRIRHTGIRLFTEELFKSLAHRVRLHATIYLLGLAGSAALSFILASII